MLCSRLSSDGSFYRFVFNGLILSGQPAISQPNRVTTFDIDQHLIPDEPSFMLLLLLPAVSMRLFSEDQKQGSFEMLLSAPLASWEIVLGKFMGAMGFVCLMLLSLAHCFLGLFWMGSPDIGVLGMNLLSILLFSGACISVGMLFSSFTKNQFIALSLSFIVCLAFWISDGLSTLADGEIAAALSPLIHASFGQDGTRCSSHQRHRVFFLFYKLLSLFDASKNRGKPMDMNQPSGKKEHSGQNSPHTKWAWTLACIGSMLVTAYAGAAAFTTKLDEQWTWVLVGGVLLLTFWFFLERQELKQSVGRRTGKRLISSLGLSALALATAVAISLIALRFDHQFDSQLPSTLSDQSKSVLRALEDPITVTAFFTEDVIQTKTAFERLMDTMALETENLKFEIHDPIQDNLIASQYLPISPYGTLFLEQGEKRQKIEGDFSEEKLIGALVQFISSEKHVICFTSGHNEMALTDYENPAGMGLFVNAMVRQNYEEKSISLINDQGIPNTCEVVVIAGPMEDFLDNELAMLSAHIKQGKHLIVALDSVLAKDEKGTFTNQRTPKLAAHMKKFGIDVGSDLVVELSPTFQIPKLDESAFVMVQDSYAEHPIIASKNTLTAFFGTREVKQSDEAVGMNVVEWVLSSQLNHRSV